MFQMPALQRLISQILIFSCLAVVLGLAGDYVKNGNEAFRASIQESTEEFSEEVKEKSFENLDTRDVVVYLYSSIGAHTNPNVAIAAQNEWRTCYILIKCNYIIQKINQNRKMQINFWWNSPLLVQNIITNLFLKMVLKMIMNLQKLHNRPRTL